MLFAAAIFLAAAVAGCVRLEQSVEVTPGTVPPEIRGASWANLPITYCIVQNEEPGFVNLETFIATTQRAMQAWGVATEFTGACTSGLVVDNGVNEIAWGDLGIRSDSLTEAGNTSLRYRSGPGNGPPQIIEADITIERAPGDKETEDCLYTTLLHEAGHLFGVPHLDMRTVMAPVITDCLQELTVTDRAAIDELY